MWFEHNGKKGQNIPISEKFFYQDSGWIAGWGELKMQSWNEKSETEFLYGSLCRKHFALMDKNLSIPVRRIEKI